MLSRVIRVYARFSFSSPQQRTYTERADKVLRFCMPEFVGDFGERTISTVKQFYGKQDAGLVDQESKFVAINLRIQRSLTVPLDYSRI